MKYTKFDRHELFNEADRSTVIDVIKVCDRSMAGQVNALYGLFDGYLYHNLLENLYGKIDYKLYSRLSRLVFKIEKHVEYVDSLMKNRK